jgi:hypothetical protein
MSLLNRPSDGLPSVLIAIFRTLRAYGSMPETELIELLAPSTTVKQDMAKKTLTRWKQIGFIDSDGPALSLAPSIASVRSDDSVLLRTEILRLIFGEKNNATLLLDDPDEDLPSGSADLSRALAWSLMQDPFTFPKNLHSVETLQGQQGIFPRAFANDTRWSGFQEWAVFLGMAVNSGKGITPNPALALSGFLDEIRGSSIELPQGVFLQRASELIPVLDGGALRKKVESTVKTSWTVLNPSDISPSLSAALLTLEASRRIRFELRSDAPEKNLLGRGARLMRPFSHIVFSGSER